MSLLIKNGKIYQKGNLISKNIYIEEGKIRKLVNSDIKAGKVIDAKGKIVLPGLIDCHVHFREPGATQKEDFFTGSQAAAAGGVTTIIAMPNTNPPVTNLQVLDETRRLAKKSIVNYGFHFGTTKDNIADVEKAQGVAGIKVYMDHTTCNLLIDGYNPLKKLFSSNKTVLVHAENENVSKAKELIQSGENKLYFCHISSEEELNYAKKDKIKNEVFVEVTPHHLFLTDTDLNDLGAFGEMKPGLKTKKDQEALWQGIRDRKVDTIGTDHAPHTKEEKLEINYPFGVPGLETMLPLLLNALNENKIELKKIIELCCENPAKIFKIKSKGFIKEGYDADLTVVDLDLEKEVVNDNLFTKCKWSPFEGRKLKGWPVCTIVNGNIVFDNGQINNIKAKEIIYS